jgi:anti-sigma B factor antagonist
MEIQEREIGGIKVVKPELVRLDAHASPEFMEDINRVIGAGGARLVLDMSAMNFMDSSGLTCIVTVYKEVTQAMGGAMVVSGLQKPLASLFRLTKLDQAIKCYATAEEGAAALTG